ncbi:MAG: hypothetical protein KDD62_08870 [Bdellovibrionales bacterium]|nr:hypothetical protein [Bdellovibrionales bacterium]
MKRIHSYSTIFFLAFLLVQLGLSAHAEPTEADRIIQTLEDSTQLKTTSAINSYSEIQIKAYQTGMRLGTKTYRKSFQDVDKGIYQVVYKLVKGKWLPGDPSRDVWRKLKYRGTISGASLFGRQVVHGGQVLYELIIQKKLDGLHVEVLLRTKKFSEGKQLIDKRLTNFLDNIARNKVMESSSPDSDEQSEVSAPVVDEEETESPIEEQIEMEIEEVATPEPTPVPTQIPSTPAPTAVPVKEEPKEPAVVATPEPTATPKPTAVPTQIPTAKPTATPTLKPAPTAVPPVATPRPTAEPAKGAGEGMPKVSEQDTKEPGRDDTDPLVGTWEGTVKSTRDGKSEKFKLRIYASDEETFDGDWQGGIAIVSGSKKGRMLLWEANNLQNGCRDYRARLDIRPDFGTAGVIVLVRDRCDKPAQFSSSGILTKK